MGVRVIVQGCEVPDVSRRTLSGSESMYLVCTAQVSITNDSILNQGLVRAPLSPIRDQSREVVSVCCTLDWTHWRTAVTNQLAALAS